MDLMRKIGVFCNAAWRMKQKIMQAMMEREDEKPLPGAVSADSVSKKNSVLGYLGFQAANPRAARPKFGLRRIVIRKFEAKRKNIALCLNLP